MTRPTIPTIMRISPTVVMSMPETVAEHLEGMLLFAGRSLRDEELYAAAEAWSPQRASSIGR
jgi:hypothetical protein